MSDSASLKSLYEDRQTLYDVLDNLPLGIVALSAAGKAIFINQTMADMLQLPLKKLFRSSPAERDGWLRLESDRRQMFNACLQGERFTGRAYLFPADGERVPVRVHSFPLYNKQGDTAGIVILIQNLQEQNVLEQSQREYRYIVDSINTGIVSIDPRGYVTTCNKAFSQYFGVKSSDLVGKYYPDLRAQIGTGSSLLVQALQTGQSIALPEFCHEVNGQDKVFSIECMPLQDESGGITGAFALVRDISTQRLIEAKVNRAQQLNIAGELGAGIAHEIRNPLTSIRGFIQLLKGRFTNTSPEQEYLEIMLGELDRANNIIKKFLLLSKPQNPKLELQDLNYLLDDMLKLVEGEALIAEVELVRRFSLEVPLMVVETESIKQVFLNLIQNAIQAMPSGGKLTVSTEFLQETNTNVVRISDTGSGIPSHLLGKLGNPFFTTRKNGTGLGLMLSYRIVENHKGKIEVESAEGAGATFTVTLPISNTPPGR